MNEVVKNALVWIDCEMTGLDPQQDALIEVAVIVTDAQLRPLDDGIDLLIKPTPEKLANMGDFVRQMHKSSGLLAELESASPDLPAAEQQVLDYISRHVEPGKGLLAGNSVGTDKTFLARYMPRVIDYLHYRIVDVSTIKELAKRWYPRAFFAAPAKLGGHRALGDIRDSIAELKYYRSVLMPASEGPDTQECETAAQTVSQWRLKLEENDA